MLFAALSHQTGNDVAGDLLALIAIAVIGRCIETRMAHRDKESSGGGLLDGFGARLTKTAVIKRIKTGAIQVTGYHVRQYSVLLRW